MLSKNVCSNYTDPNSIMFLVFNIKHCRVLHMSNVWNTTNLLGTVVSTNIFISVNTDFWF